METEMPDEDEIIGVGKVALTAGGCKNMEQAFKWKRNASKQAREEIPYSWTVVAGNLGGVSRTTINAIRKGGTTTRRMLRDICAELDWLPIEEQDFISVDKPKIKKPIPAPNEWEQNYRAI